MTNNKLLYLYLHLYAMLLQYYYIALVLLPSQVSSLSVPEACCSPATPQTHQLNTLAKNMRQVTLAPSMPALHTSWHSRAAGGMARWPGRIRQHALLYSTRAQDMDSTHRPQQ